MKIVLKSIVIIFVLLLGGFLFLLTTHVGGWKGFIVMSASMEPHIPTGSLVITQQIPPKELKKGDVITFVRPDNTKELITHRIETINQRDNLATIKTKGDKNPYPDIWTLAGGGVVGKVQLALPYVGYLLSFTQTKMGILFFILIPAVYIIVEELQSVTKLFKKHTKPKPEVLQSATVLIMAIWGTSLVTLPTRALLSDNTPLTKNTFTVIQNTPEENCTPTPMKRH